MLQQAVYELPTPPARRDNIESLSAPVTCPTAFGDIAG